MDFKNYDLEDSFSTRDNRWKIAINNNCQLEYMNPKFCRKTNDFPTIYNLICDKLKIDIDSFIVHDKIAEHFRNIRKFGVFDVEN